MEIRLKLGTGNQIKLSILEGKKERDGIGWQDKNNLSRFLLLKLDKLFRKNKLGLDKISGYKIISDVPEKWTTYRIAKITLETLVLAKKKTLC